MSGSKRARKVWAPMFEKSSKLKLVFSGHVHNYERFLEGSCRYVVSGGGGSPRFRLRSLGRLRYADRYEDENRKRFFHYMRLTVEKSRMFAEMVRWTGSAWNVGDSFVVE